MVVPAAARESAGDSGPAAFEDKAVERSLASLRPVAAAKPGGVFADEAFALPPPEDSVERGKGKNRSGVTLSRWTIYAYLTVVPVIAVTAFLLGCWWSAFGSR